MKKAFRVILAISMAAVVLFSGCVATPEKINDDKDNQNIQETQDEDRGLNGTSTEEQGEDVEGDEISQGADEQKDTGNNEVPEPQINLEEVKPNEVGKIMVVMFHNFIEQYESGDKEYTTTFNAFRELLQTLYDKDYRLINVSDYLNNKIDVPAGCIPMIFTFDDGTAGQFNLIEKGGKLTANPQSAVGIMEEFNETYPDFGLKGTFYVNLGLGTFKGEGTLSEKLNYLINKGFEIGNHTLTHIKLNEAKNAEEIVKDIGGNQKKMYELVPGYKMISFSLPYGLPSEELKEYVFKGKFEEIEYENFAVMEVGANPAFSPVSTSFNPLSTPRVRASGIEPVDADLAWWLERLSRGEQYISDGNPDTITVPKDREETVDDGKLGGKKLIVY